MLEVAPWSFWRNGRHTPTSGPLLSLFSASEMCLFPMSAWLNSSFVVKPLLRSHRLMEAYTDLHLWYCTPSALLSAPQLPLPYCIFYYAYHFERHYLVVSHSYGLLFVPLAEVKESHGQRSLLFSLLTKKFGKYLGGYLTGSVGRAWDSWPKGCRSEPHTGCLFLPKNKIFEK